MPNKQIEKKGSDDLRNYMAVREWVTIKIPGGRFLKGFPDLFAAHRLHGIILIETKKPRGGVLSESQITMFRKLNRFGVRIYIAHDSRDYDKLFGKPNWVPYALGQTDIRMPIGIRPTRENCDRLDR